MKKRQKDVIPVNVEEKAETILKKQQCVKTVKEMQAD